SGMIAAAKYLYVRAASQCRPHPNQYIAWPELRHIHNLNLQVLFTVQDGRGHLLSHSVLTSGAVLRSSTIPRLDATPAQFQHEYHLMNIGAKSILRQGARPKTPAPPIP